MPVISPKAKPVKNTSLTQIMGIVLLALALQLLVAQLSFDRNDLPFVRVPPNRHAQNWIGEGGAYLAYATFCPLGIAAYALPWLFALLGFSYLFNLFAYLRVHLRWTLCWMSLLLISMTGLLHVAGGIHWLAAMARSIYAPFAGGWLGYLTYGQTQDGKFGFALLSPLGAAVLYATLAIISLLFLMKSLLPVHNLSVPQKEIVPEPEVPKIGEVIDSNEIQSAKTDEMTGNKSDMPEKIVKAEAEKTERPTAETENPAEPKPEPVIQIADGHMPLPTPRPHPAPIQRPKPITVASTPLIGNYQLPPMDFLQHADMTAKPTESKEELMANARLMQQTLAQFGIEVSLGDITKGPTITRYELHPAPGVKLEKIQSLSNNLAASLKAERIHILVPVPGKSSVGVEVPNSIKTKVIMRDLFESDEWQHTKARIPIALGKDVYGHPIVADLAEMPHLLIAGSTGSGKSVCINSIIASLLYRFSPDQLRFVMIDPKVVEMQQYNALPHLVVPVVTDPKKVLLALRWVVNEMEKRYQIFARVGVRNIKSFNDRPKDKPLPPAEPELPLAAKKEKVEPGADGFAVEVDEQIVVPREEDIIIPEKLSYIVVIIDELADLMLVAPADVEMAIARITQMARAAGIHCIVATQRPSVDVITGCHQGEIPARIAFQVASRVDSRTILDAMGADKLLGKGDMLVSAAGFGQSQARPGRADHRP